MSGTHEAFSIIAILLSLLSLLTAISALGITLGLKWSTHRIEFKPLVTQELKDEEKFKEEDEDDKLLEAALNLSRKKKKQEDPLDSILETSNF